MQLNRDISDAQNYTLRHTAEAGARGNGGDLALHSVTTLLGGTLGIGTAGHGGSAASAVTTQYNFVSRNAAHALAFPAGGAVALGGAGGQGGLVQMTGAAINATHVFTLVGGAGGNGGNAQASAQPASPNMAISIIPCVEAVGICVGGPGLPAVWNDCQAGGSCSETQLFGVGGIGSGLSSECTSNTAVYTPLDSIADQITAQLTVHPTLAAMGPTISAAITAPSQPGLEKNGSEAG